MTKFLAAIIAFAALTAVDISAAKAEINYPWCAYYGRFGTAATNCGFTTLRQCQETVSGIGGYCARNPRYHVRKKKTRR